MKKPDIKEFFDVLACPVCKGSLSYDKEKTGLLCAKCKHKYPIKDGIAVLKQ